MNTICQKCGGEDIATRFCRGTRYVEHLYSEPRHDDEKLHRHCRRCGFDWLEDCFDSDPERAKGVSK